jgi:hypothetical protein
MNFLIISVSYKSGIVKRDKKSLKPKEENGKIAKTLQVMQLQRHGYPRTTDSCSPRG